MHAMEEWLVKNTKFSQRDGSIVNVPLMGLEMNEVFEGRADVKRCVW